MPAAVARKLWIGPKAIKRPWMPDEDAQLLALLEQLTPSQIARRLERTLMSVKHRMRYHGLRAKVVGRRNPKTQQWQACRLWTQKEELQLAYLAGSTLTSTAARKLGRSRYAVIQRCCKLGIKWHKGKLTATELAKQLRVHNGTVGRIARRLRLGSYRFGKRAPWSFTDEQADKIAAAVGRKRRLP